MKYFETRHQRNSAKITTLITLILVLLLFVVGMPFMDPPLEYGVAVNFGTSNVGSGIKPKAMPVKAQEPKVTESSEAQEVTPQKTEQAAKTEEVLTQDTAESIAIKKQKEAEALAKAEAERLEREKREAEERRLKEEAEKRKNLDNLIGSVKNSSSAENEGEGPDNATGIKGDSLVDPYAPYTDIPGTGNGGIGVGLNGRGKADFKIYDGCENEYGDVVVAIVVNREGRVIEANAGEQGTNNRTTCLIEQAEKIARSFKWKADSKAPPRQIGRIKIIFSPN